jgi:single-stranded-DNA-specific exonuclease
VVIGFCDGQGRGSARTVGDFDLYQGLHRCRQHLTGFGGHPMAAGLSLDWGAVDAFRSAFVSAAAEHFAMATPSGPVEVDAIASLAELDMAQVEELARLAPFGSANSEPLIVVPGVVVRSTRVVGASHLQLTLAHGASTSDAIAFGMGDRDPGQGARLDVMGTAEVDAFRGRRKMRLRLKHFVRSLSPT